MSDEVNEILEKLIQKQSTLLTYAEIIKAFVIGQDVDLGNGATARAIELTDKHIIIRLFMPKDTIVQTFHHDCKEETKIIYGLVRETVLNVHYGSFHNYSVRKGVPHGFLALKDTLSYSILYNPNGND